LLILDGHVNFMCDYMPVVIFGHFFNVELFSNLKMEYVLEVTGGYDYQNVKS